MKKRAECRLIGDMWHIFLDGRQEATGKSVLQAIAHQDEMRHLYTPEECDMLLSAMLECVS